MKTFSYSIAMMRYIHIILILSLCLNQTLQGYALRSRTEHYLRPTAYRESREGLVASYAIKGEADYVDIFRVEGTRPEEDEIIRDLMLEGNAFDYNWIDSIVGTANSPNSITFIARANDQIVGVVTGAQPGKTDRKKYIAYDNAHYLVGIAVRKSVCGNEIGRTLLELYMEAAKEEGHDYVALHQSNSTDPKFIGLLWSFFWNMIVPDRDVKLLPMDRGKRGKLYVFDLAKHPTDPSKASSAGDTEPPEIDDFDGDLLGTDRALISFRIRVEIAVNRAESLQVLRRIVEHLRKTVIPEKTGPCHEIINELAAQREDYIQAERVRLFDELGTRYDTLWEEFRAFNSALREYEKSLKSLAESRHFKDYQELISQLGKEKAEWKRANPGKSILEEVKKGRHDWSKVEAELRSVLELRLEYIATLGGSVKEKSREETEDTDRSEDYTESFADRLIKYIANIGQHLDAKEVFEIYPMPPIISKGKLEFRLAHIQLSDEKVIRDPNFFCIYMQYSEVFLFHSCKELVVGFKPVLKQDNVLHMLKLGKLVLRLTRRTRLARRVLSAIAAEA
ncbi:GNAT family N-acetyltransferase [Candidatus Omnitrophota bacterium]